MITNLHLNVLNAPAEVLKDENPSVGDIYRKAGGPPGFWWIISVMAGVGCYAISFNRNGYITGCQRYNTSYFAEKDHRRVGFAEVKVINPEWF